MSLGLDWSVIDIYEDPVPGDPDGVKQCSSQAHSKSSSVDSFLKEVDLMREKHEDKSAFVGEAANQFLSKLDKFPEKLTKLSTGLKKTSTVLKSWSDSMRNCQKNAGSAYQRAVAAKNSISSAQSQLDSAQKDALKANTDKNLLRVKRMLGADVDDADERRARHRVDAAEGQVASFRKQLESAQESYDAARRDVMNAKDEYDIGADSAATTLKGALDDLPGVSTWDRVYYSDAWRTVVKIAEVAGIAVGIAMLILGPGGILSLLAFALAAVGFVNDALAYAHGDEDLQQLGLGVASLLLSAPTGITKEGAAGLRFFADSKGLPMYQRVIGGLNSFGRNSGMVTDVESALRASKYTLFKDTGLSSADEALGVVWALAKGRGRDATRMFNGYQIKGLLPHNWNWVLGKSHLYKVVNPTSTSTMVRYGLEGSREAIRRGAMKDVAKDIVDEVKRVRGHRLEDKTGVGAAVSEWAGLLAPAVPGSGLVGEVAEAVS